MMAKKAKAANKKTKVKPPAPPAPAPLKPPPGGAVVRMYRIGHGDCFLIAFAGKDPDKPAYVLIDCGYKPGSPGKLAEPTKVKEIGEHIIATTGGFVDVGIVTHEHQDHVNGLTSGNFPGRKRGKVWFAWTDNRKDDIANERRKRVTDRLRGSSDARRKLRDQTGKAAIGRERDGSVESGWGECRNGLTGFDPLPGASKDPAGSANKVAMKFLSDCAKAGGG